MKARMVSRVTEMPKFDRGEDLPEKGWRNGTRASAVANWPASSDTSNATIGGDAVFTSGRSPIAMSVRLPRLDCKVNLAWGRSSLMVRCDSCSGARGAHARTSRVADPPGALSTVRGCQPSASRAR